jgi:hypothetical protein
VGLADLFAEPLADTVIHATPGKGRAVYLPQIVLPREFRIGMLPDNRADLLEAVRWAADGPLQVEIKAPETVTMSLYSQPTTGRRLLHLVNYDEANPVRDIEVTLQVPEGKSAVTVSLLSTELEGANPLAAQINGRTLRFTVPQLNLYSLLVIG